MSGHGPFVRPGWHIGSSIGPGGIYGKLRDEVPIFEPSPEYPVEVDFAVCRTTTGLLTFVAVVQTEGEPVLHIVVVMPRVPFGVWHAGYLELRVLDGTPPLSREWADDEPLRLGSGPSGPLAFDAAIRKRLVTWASSLPEAVLARLP